MIFSILLRKTTDGKNKALNNAIRHATSDWLIFIDGDCVLHPRFVEMHLRFAGEKVILAGKRVKLDPETSGFLQNNMPEAIGEMQKEMHPETLYRKRKNHFHRRKHLHLARRLVALLSLHSGKPTA